MSDDLIKALQKEAREDAEIITRLRADLAAVKEERDRMREALKPLAKAIKGQIADILFGEMPDNSTATVILQLGDLRRARAALEGVTEPAKGEGNER